jgi:predicted aspartyl protease
MFQVAGGKTIEVGVSVLSSIQVGPIEKKDISVCIIDSHQGSKSYQGLLGMNFLSNVNYRIDFKKQLMIWD